MKGMELPALIFAFLFMVGVSFVMAGLVVWVMNNAPSSKTYSMVVTGLHIPVKQEVALMAYLEATSPSGIQMKDIIVAAAMQNRTDPWVKGSRITNVNDVSNSIFTSWYSGRPYLLLLKLQGKDHVLAGAPGDFTETGQRMIIKKVSTPVYTTTGEAKLELYVG